MRFFQKTKKKDGWLALVIQRDGIAVVHASRPDGGKPQVLRAEFVPGTPGPALLEKAGREALARQHRCTTLLDAGEYQLLAVEPPSVPPQEMRTAVRWRLKDVLDFPVTEATVDVIDMPIDANAPRPQNTLFAVAARNSVVAARQALFADARLPLAVIDIPEMAQRNLAALFEPAGRGVAMLSFADEGGLLTVSYRGELYLSRRIELPLAALADEDHERRVQAFDRVTLELQRSLDAVERQFSFINVAKLVLAPSPLADLTAYLASNLYTPVEAPGLGEVIDLAGMPALADAIGQQRFLLAIGAALREEGERT